jgi:hypothetical protein
MKKIFLMTALSVAMFGVMNAQNTATTTQTATTQLPQVRAKAMVAKVNSAVQLTTTQFGTVNDLYIGYFTQVDAAKGDASKVATLTKSTDEKLLTLLTPEQVKLWKAASSK